MPDPEQETKIGERLRAMCTAHGPSQDMLRLHAYVNEQIAFVVEQYGGFVDVKSAESAMTEMQLFLELFRMIDPEATEILHVG